jgi:hypothetical protein
VSNIESAPEDTVKDKDEQVQESEGEDPGLRYKYSAGLK